MKPRIKREKGKAYMISFSIYILNLEERESVCFTVNPSIINGCMKKAYLAGIASLVVLPMLYHIMSSPFFLFFILNLFINLVISRYVVSFSLRINI